MSVLRGSKLMLEEVKAFLTLGGAEEGWAEGNTHAIRPRWEKSTLLRDSNLSADRYRKGSIENLCSAEHLREMAFRRRKINSVKMHWHL